MLKSLLLSVCLSATLAACASSPTAAVRPAAAVIPSGLPLGCVPAPQTQRCDQFGTYYSGDDLRRTGAPHVGAALNQLDPALTH